MARPNNSKSMNNKILIGSIENFALPELGISSLEVRIDTGAQTSSLHVDNIELCEDASTNWVRFDIHPNVHDVDEVLECSAQLKAERNIKSSNGTSEKRYVIETIVQLAGQSWPIELSLTDRSDMNYLMLFGREGMADRVLIDPSSTFLLKSGD